MSSIYVPDNPGTVAFTNGSTAIVGSGTLLRGMSAGGLISIPGLGEMQLAEDPTSDTEAVGVVEWQGADTGPRPYQHVPRNAQATFSQKLAQLVSVLAGGNIQSLAELEIDANALIKGTGPGALEAVALTGNKLLATDASGDLIQADLQDWAKGMLGLVGAANKLPYLDDNGDAALTGLTATARTILAAEEHDEVLQGLGVTPFWQDRITADADAGQALGGLGVTPFWLERVTTDVDADDARVGMGVDDASFLTKGTLPDGRVGDTLTPDKAFRRGNILGAVAEAAGVPTGALIQNISNSNGWAVRFADGTQICRATVNLTNTTDSSNKTATWVFPAVFAGGGGIMVIHNPNAASSWGDDQGIFRGQAESVEQITASSCVLSLGRSSGLWSASKTIPTYAFAIGRWF